jgi:hypothetical protein
MEALPATIELVPEELTLTLGKEHLEALGLEAPVAGTKVRISALATVTSSATHDADASGHVSHCCVRLKLKELSVEDMEGPTTAPTAREQMAERIYSRPKGR